MDTNCSQTAPAAESEIADTIRRAQKEHNLPPLPSSLPPLQAREGDADSCDPEEDDLLQPGDWTVTEMETSADHEPARPQSPDASSEPEPEPEPDSTDTSGDPEQGDDAHPSDEPVEVEEGSEADSEESDSDGCSDASDDESAEVNPDPYADQDQPEEAPSGDDPSDPEQEESEPADEDDSEADSPDEIAEPKYFVWHDLAGVDFKNTRYATNTKIKSTDVTVDQGAATNAYWTAPEVVQGKNRHAPFVVFSTANRESVPLTKPIKADRSSDLSPELVDDEDADESAADAPAAAAEASPADTPMHPPPKSRQVAVFSEQLYRMQQRVLGFTDPSNHQQAPAVLTYRNSKANPTPTTTVSLDPANNRATVLRPKQRKYGTFKNLIHAKLLWMAATVIRPDGTVVSHITFCVAYVSRGLTHQQKAAQRNRIQRDVFAWAMDVLTEYLGDQCIERVPSTCPKAYDFVQFIAEPIQNAIRSLQFAHEFAEITAHATMFGIQHEVMTGKCTEEARILADMIKSHAPPKPDETDPSCAAVAFYAAALAKTVRALKTALDAADESEIAAFKRVIAWLRNVCTEFDRCCVTGESIAASVKWLIRKLGKIATAAGAAASTFGIDAGELKALKNTSPDTLDEIKVAIKNHFAIKAQIAAAFDDDDDDQAEDEDIAADALDPEVKKAAAEEHAVVVEQANKVADQVVDSAQGGLKDLCHESFSGVMQTIEKLSKDEPETQLEAAKIVLKRIQKFAQDEAARKKEVAERAKANREMKRQQARNKLDKLRQVASTPRTRSSTRNNTKRSRPDNEEADGSRRASKRSCVHTVAARPAKHTLVSEPGTAKRTRHS